MPDSPNYERRAEEFGALADASDDPEVALGYRELARYYLILAEAQARRRAAHWLAPTRGGSEGE
jgi:hypothetical protein